MSLRLLTVVLTLICFTACTSLRPVRDLSPAAVARSVEPGDEVHVQTRDGTWYRFEVQHVTGEALVGPKRPIPFSDIRAIEVDRFDGSKTAGLVTVILVTTALVLGAILKDAADALNEGLTLD